METAFPEYILANGPWAYSKVGVISKCSLQFDFKYGAVKHTESSTATPDSRIGRAVHLALEHALKGIKMLLAFRMAIDTEGLTTDERERAISYYDQVKAFVARMEAFQNKHGVKSQNVLIEYPLGLTPDFKGTGFYDKKGLFRGKLDLVMITAHGDAVIIDHKTGKQKEMAMYEDQCKAYCVLVLANRPELKGVQTAINFVQTDQLVWNPRVTAETIRNEYYPWLQKYLIDSCVDLKEPPTPKEGWWCDWCGYKDRCPNFLNKKA